MCETCFKDRGIDRLCVETCFNDRGIDVLCVETCFRDRGVDLGFSSCMSFVLPSFSPLP